MNSRQSNVLDSSRALKALFASNPTVVTTIVGLKPALDVFLSQLEVVEGLAKRQGQRLEVSLLRRDNAMGEAIDAAMEVGGIVLGHAERNNLMELAANVCVKITDFTHGRLDDRVRLAKHVHDVIEAQLPTLTESGVTAAMLADLQKKIEDADTALATPRAMVVEKSSATEELTTAFRQLTAIRTRQLDPLIVPLEKKNPEFFVKYRAARMLINRPGTRSEPDTGTPVPPIDGTAVAPAAVTHATEVAKAA